MKEKKKGLPGLCYMGLEDRKTMFNFSSFVCIAFDDWVIRCESMSKDCNLL